MRDTGCEGAPSGRRAYAVWTEGTGLVETQERVWNDLSEWQLEDPGSIRDTLTADEVTVRDRRVKFVTPKAYEKAGGAVRRDLFKGRGRG